MGFSAYNYICEEDAEFAGQCQKLSEFKLPIHCLTVVVNH